MIIYKHGNLLEDDAQVLVNPVNCVGIMGKGLAAQFKREYPNNFKAYKKACEAQEIKIGTIFVHDEGGVWGEKYIFNFPTKKHWRNKSQLKDIAIGLKDFAIKLREYNIRSVAIPQLGCGLGGLAWESVSSLIEKELAHVKNVDVRIYGPELMTKKKPVKSGKKRNMYMQVLCFYKQRGIELQNDNTISEQELQGLGYILQKAGCNLRLEFTVGEYGLQSPGLKKVIADMVPTYLEKDDESYFRVSSKFKRMHKNPEEAKIMKKAIGFLEGHESPYGIYLLTMVDWIMQNQMNSSKIEAKDILTKIKNISVKTRTPNIYQIQKVMKRLQLA